MSLRQYLLTKRYSSFFTPHGTFGLRFFSRSMKKKTDYSLSTTTVCQAFIMNSDEKREARLRKKESVALLKAGDEISKAPCGGWS